MPWPSLKSGPTGRMEAEPLPPVAVRWMWKRASALLVEGLSQREVAARICVEVELKPWITENGRPD